MVVFDLGLDDSLVVERVLFNSLASMSRSRGGVAKSWTTSVLEMWRVDSDFRCPGFNQRVLRAIKSSNAKLVVLVGSFVNNVTIGKFRDINAGYVIDSCRSMQEFEINLQQTVEHTHAPGAKVVVFTEPPTLKCKLGKRISS